MNFFLIEKNNSLVSIVRSILIITLLVFIINMTMPQVALAETTATLDPSLALNSAPKDVLADRFVNPPAPELLVPVVARTMKVTATAYTSAIEETDDTPCITANGFDVCKNGEENVLAANFLRFGTKVRLPDMYGDKIFTVQDRMNARYAERIDLWKLSKKSAKQFGVRYVRIEILQ